MNDELEILQTLIGRSKTNIGIARQTELLLSDMIQKNYAANNLNFWKGVKQFASKLPAHAKGHKKLLAAIGLQTKKIQREQKAASSVNNRTSINPARISIQVVVVLAIILLGIFDVQKMYSAFAPAEPTATVPPIITLSPTVMPTQTLSPTFTPTLSPTPLPSSIYLINNNDIASIDPKLPIAPKIVWKLPAFAPCDNTKYCADMDAPIESGKHAIYVHDNPQILIGSQLTMPFEILLQDIDSVGALRTEPIMPSLGLGHIQLGTLNEISIFNNPVPTAWVWVGNYDLERTGIVKITVGPFDDNSKISPHAFDQVLLVKLDDAQWNQLTIDVDGYKLVTILDDTNLYSENSKLVEPATTLSDFWNGTGHFLNKKGTITFTGSGVLPPGTYKALYHIVGGGSGEMGIKIRTGTQQKIDDWEKIKPFPIQADPPWLDLEDFTLEKAAQVLFEITNGDSSKNSIPVDVILIYQKIIP